MERNDLSIDSIKSDNIECIKPILISLAEHHNKISKYFNGVFPFKSFEETITEITEEIKNGVSVVDIVKINNQIIGFSQYKIENNMGELKYLAILPEYRNKGYGKLLMDKVMEYFKIHQVKRIEIRVAYGNDEAKKFYEKYGFKVLAQIMAISKY